MIRRLRSVAVAVFVFAIVSGGDCEIGSLGSILDKPGQIVVTNVGTERAVLAIIADDVKTYPTLGQGATASAQTNVGGAYQVQVVMSPENAEQYRTSLSELRSNVEDLIAGSASPEEKTALFLKLAGIKAAIQSLENVNTASCNGTIELERDNRVTVNATVQWIAQGGGTGFWDLTCGSNSGS